VIFSISTLDIRTHRWLITLLEINPAALYITLVRNALLQSQRLSEPGSKPYNAALCHAWKTLGHAVGKPTSFQYDSAYCHYAANPSHFWYYAVGWAILAVLVGFFFFWRAETRYGRG
jgi:teichoic acid transport system permease protein